MSDPRKGSAEEFAKNTPEFWSLAINQGRSAPGCERIFKFADACSASRFPRSEREQEDLHKRLDVMTQAEHDLSDAYLRIRKLVNAFDTPHAPTAQQVWEHTENKIRKLLRGASAVPSPAATPLQVDPSIWAFPPKTSNHPCEHGARPEECTLCDPLDRRLMHCPGDSPGVTHYESHDCAEAGCTPVVEAAQPSEAVSSTAAPEEKNKS